MTMEVDRNTSRPMALSDRHEATSADDGGLRIVRQTLSRRSFGFGFLDCSAGAEIAFEIEISIGTNSLAAERGDCRRSFLAIELAR